MSVRIRLESDDQAALDAHEQALRTVLTLPGEPSRDYPNRRSSGGRRYLESTGVRTPGAGGPAPLDVATAAKQRRDLPGEIGALTAADADLKQRWWFPLRPGDIVLSYLPPVADSPAYGQTYVAVDEGTDPAGCALLREVSTTDLPDPEPAVDLPEYLLVYDEPNTHWQLECPDDETGTDLAPWVAAEYLTDPEDVGAAKEWATRQIGRIEDPDDRPVQGWKPWPSGQSTGLAAVFPEPPAGPHLTDFYSLWFEAGPDVVTVIRAGAVVHGNPTRTGVTR